MAHCPSCEVSSSSPQLSDDVLLIGYGTVPSLACELGGAAQASQGEDRGGALLLHSSHEGSHFRLNCPSCSRSLFPCRCCLRGMISFSLDNPFAVCTSCGFIEVLSIELGSCLRLDPRPWLVTEDELRRVQRQRNEAQFVEKVKTELASIKERSKSKVRRHPVDSREGSMGEGNRDGDHEEIGGEGGEMQDFCSLEDHHSTFSSDKVQHDSTPFSTDVSEGSRSEDDKDTQLERLFRMLNKLKNGQQRLEDMNPAKFSKPEELEQEDLDHLALLYSEKKSGKIDESPQASLLLRLQVFKKLVPDLCRLQRKASQLAAVVHADSKVQENKMISSFLRRRAATQAQRLRPFHELALEILLDINKELLTLFNHVHQHSMDSADLTRFTNAAYKVRLWRKAYLYVVSFLRIVQTPPTSS